MSEFVAPSDARQQPGNSDSFQLSIRHITLGDIQLSLPGPGSITAVVGPNNVGKSTLLREIKQYLSMHAGQNPPLLRVMTSLRFEVAGTQSDMEAWLDERGKINPNERREGGQSPYHRLHTDLRSGRTPGNLASMFVSHQPAFDREKVCNPVARLDDIGARPQYPLQALQINAEARAKIQALGAKLFNEHLELDFLSGNIGFRLGEPGVPAPPVNDISTEYARALAALPRLDQQGDGIRCALGLLIPLITESHCISLIDEPEAFLHPPQARTLGTEIGKIVHHNQSQVIVATHDKNFLQGIVESNIPVAIVHLTREGNKSFAQLLETGDVRELWRDTTLRYGNALDGLFHAGVIVTESDRDSQFYAAAIDHLLSQADPPRVHNLMFLAAYGKANMAPIITRLSRLGVRTVSNPDLDVLNDKTVLQALVEAHGGEWTHFESNYNKATNQFRQDPPPPTVAAVRSQLERIFAEAEGSNFSKELAKRIRETITVPSAWSQLKKSGDRAFRSEKSAATALLADLDELGIVTVRVGELENFVTTANASKGAGFLKIAFDEEAQKSDEAQKHATRLLVALGQRTH